MSKELVGPKDVFRHGVHKDSHRHLQLLLLLHHALRPEASAACGPGLWTLCLVLGKGSEGSLVWVSDRNVTVTIPLEVFVLSGRKD